MPLQNRVTPFGEIVAVPERGLLMGNRGILHDAHQRLIRDSQVRRWIACRLEFRGRHRTVMRPGSYTELFFLDEAAAFAAGHRPCAECRHADYRRFQAAWTTAFPDRSARADAMDAQLHAERRAGPWQKNVAPALIQNLPDGAYIAHEGRAWLVWGDRLLAWSAGGYVDQHPRPSTGGVTLLTPVSIVAALRAGYQPAIHPSAAAC
jgi:hypothetical protein